MTLITIRAQAIWLKKELCIKYSVHHKDDPAEYNRQVSLARRKKDPIGYLLVQAKYRAKKLGLNFDITKQDLEIPTHCPIMGIPLQITEGKRGPNSYSLDRQDNSKGYIKGNVRVISFLANSRKGDLTIEQVERLLAYMKGEL